MELQIKGLLGEGKALNKIKTSVPYGLHVVCFRSIGTEWVNYIEVPLPLPTLKTDETEAGSCPQDEIAQTSMISVPVEGFIKQDSQTVDEASIPRLWRHVNMLGNAIYTYFAICGFSKNRVQDITKFTDEIKVRQ